MAGSAPRAATTDANRQLIERTYDAFRRGDIPAVLSALADVLAKDERVIVLVTESARRHGRVWSSPQVHAWTVRVGQAKVFWQFQGDQQTEDEFWS